MKYNQAKNEPGVNLIEFYASWCPHCQRMMPIVEQIREMVGSRVGVYQYDIDQYPREADEAGASSVPTFIIYKDGEEQWRDTGEMSGDELLGRIEDALR